jgi:hypothetical protein
MIITAMNFLFVALVVKMLNGIKNQAPVGYQDEAGFHFGERN